MATPISYQKWTEDQLALIEQIKKHPTLYMKNENNYIPHDLVWNNISKELGLPVECCKRRWKAIRDNYVKRRKLICENYVVYSSKYIDTDTLQFLDEFVPHRLKVAKPLKIGKKNKEKLKLMGIKVDNISAEDKKNKEISSALKTNPARCADKEKVENKIRNTLDNNESKVTVKIKERNNKPQCLITEGCGKLQDNENNNNQIAVKKTRKRNTSKNKKKNKDTDTNNGSSENIVNNFQEHVIKIMNEVEAECRKENKSSKKKTKNKTVQDDNFNDLSKINKINETINAEIPQDILDSILESTDEDLTINNNYDIQNVVNLDHMAGNTTNGTLITQDIIDSVLTDTERENTVNNKYNLHTIVNLSTKEIESNLLLAKPDIDTSEGNFNDSAPINQYTFIIPEGMPVGNTYAETINLDNIISDVPIQTLQPPATLVTEESQDPLIWTTIPSLEFDIIDKDKSAQLTDLPLQEFISEVNTAIASDENIFFPFINEVPKNHIANVFDINSENSDIKMFFSDMANYVSTNLSLNKQKELRLHICSMLTKAELGEVEKTEKETELIMNKLA